ncbi:TDT family transporter [Halanaerobium praevalens]|uniref:C4-dicarboxylate transporter/malic acid transport protein n=1 Tax=Halanaerobium praevalens (strain ATCC 33744 / DSM 2228 / GSL) TaxID=572479 RepID=E3DNX6_HALPG|nr:TDT family transporter [Halanaerobium praevalens]ADO76600.1 C4-dicarboxylate transporter/malic acid transport protein [Halanaerobium praevalens DSM 2228]
MNKMKKLIKNTPLVISGLMLGLAGLGNLIAGYNQNYKIAAGLLAAFILCLLAAKFLFFCPNCLKEIENPLIASVCLTIPMAIMILTTYILSFAPVLAKLLWYTAIILHALFIILFSIKISKNFNLKKVFPSYFIVYVGIVVASVTAPAFNKLQLGQQLFYFGFISYLILVPIISYRVFIIKQIPTPALPTITIFTAPAGLCLAGYLSSFPEKNIILLSFLIFLSLASIIPIIIYLPKMLKNGFYPSFSAFTFPFVITGIGLKMSNFYLTNNFDLNFLSYPAKIIEFLAIFLVGFVLISYTNFLVKKSV